MNYSYAMAPQSGMQPIAMQGRTPPPMGRSPPPMGQPFPMARSSPPMPLVGVSPQPQYPPLLPTAGSPPPAQFPYSVMPLAGSMPPAYPIAGSPEPQTERLGLASSGPFPAPVPRAARMPANQGQALSSPAPRTHTSPRLASLPPQSPRPPDSPGLESDLWREHAQGAQMRNRSVDPGMSAPAAARSRKLEMPPTLGSAISLSEQAVDPNFHYGPGLRITNHRPYLVQKANLRGQNNNDISEKVSLYDILLEVDGNPTDQVDPEDSLHGKADSTAHLTLQSGSSGQRYDIVCKRHLLSPVPHGLKKKYKANNNLAGQELRAEAQIVQELEKLRLEVSDGFGMAKDLMADNSASTLGFHLRAGEHGHGVEVSNGVSAVIPGGPAWLSGKVNVGDLVVSVDGQPVDGHSDVLGMLRGDGCVGMTKTVQLRSPQGVLADATISRTPMSEVERLGRVIQSLETLELHIKAGADRGVLLDLHRDVAKGVLDGADAHLAKEEALANRLLVMQSAVSDRINVLLTTLHPQGPPSNPPPLRSPSHPPPGVQSPEAGAELKRQLEESMANTEALRVRAKQLNQQLRETQDQLNAANEQSAALQAKLVSEEAEIEALRRKLEDTAQDETDRIRERAEVYENKWNEESKRAEGLHAEVQRLQSALTRMQAGKDGAEQQARLLEEKVRGLSNRLHEMEEDHKTVSEQATRAEDELRVHKAEVPALRAAAHPPPPPPPQENADDSIQEEYEGLLKELADAGLKDPGDVDHLLTAMKGPPATDAHSVAALIESQRRSKLSTHEACAAIVGAGHPHPPTTNGDSKAAMEVLEKENATLRRRVVEVEELLGFGEDKKVKKTDDDEDVKQLRDHDQFMTQLVERLQAEVHALAEGAEHARGERDAAVSKLSEMKDELHRTAQDADNVARAHHQDRVSNADRLCGVETLAYQSRMLQLALEDADKEVQSLHGELVRMREMVRAAQAGEQGEHLERDHLEHEVVKLRDHDHKIADVLEDLRHRVRGHKASEARIRGGLESMLHDIIGMRHQCIAIERAQHEELQAGVPEEMVARMQDEIVNQYEQLKRANRIIEDLRRVHLEQPPPRLPPADHTARHQPPVQIARSPPPEAGYQPPKTNIEIEPPAIVPRGGRFPPGPVKVEIVAQQRASVIYATTTGLEPSPAHHEVKGHSPLAVTVTRPCTIKAMLSNGLLGSATMVADFDFVDSEQSPPSERGLSPAGSGSPAVPQVMFVRPHRDANLDSSLTYAGPDTGVRDSSPRPGRPRTIAGADGEGMAPLAGVGVVLKRDQDVVRVKDVAPGSAAALDGNIQVRDRLLSIDGRSVQGKSMSTLGDEIRGVEGTYISMTFSSAGGRAGHGPLEYEVSLCRTMPLMAASAMER